MANQYIFFDAPLSARFIAFAHTLGIAGQAHADPIEGVVVDFPDHLSDDAFDALEAEYDVLMDEQRALIDAQDETASGVKMGVEITLADGQACVVSLPAALGRRLLEHFSPDEIHTLVSAIAANVAAPSLAPLCCRP